MGNENSDSFDLQILLRSGYLDIRRIAENNVLVAEYFCLLSEFDDYAPQILDVLAQVADHGDLKNVFQCLSDAKTLLECIGCKKFIPAINEIISAADRDDKDSATTFAKTISNDFYRFYKQIQSAKSSEKSVTIDEAPEMDDQVFKNFASSYGNHTLKKILQLLDRGEATRKLRILAVDDTPVALKIISSALGGEYKVYGMTDPKMLEPFLRQVTPELFILDYRMPELSGFDLIPIIRRFDEHKTTPIIFLTSMGTSDHISTAVHLGACDFIVKPFHAEILREKVAKHIVRKVLY